MGDSAAAFNAKEFRMHGLAIDQHVVGLQAIDLEIGWVLRLTFKRILFHKVGHCRRFNVAIQDKSFIFLHIHQRIFERKRAGKFWHAFRWLICNKINAIRPEKVTAGPKTRRR